MAESISRVLAELKSGRESTLKLETYEKLKPSERKEVRDYIHRVDLVHSKQDRMVGEVTDATPAPAPVIKRRRFKLPPSEASNDVAAIEEIGYIGHKGIGYGEAKLKSVKVSNNNKKLTIVFTFDEDVLFFQLPERLALYKSLYGKKIVYKTYKEDIEIYPAHNQITIVKEYNEDWSRFSRYYDDAAAAYEEAKAIDALGDTTVASSPSVTIA